KRATYDDLRYFLAQEASIDANTDDFLALLQLGTQGGVKLEIGANFWDEMGRGTESEMHSVLFGRALEAFEGVDPVPFETDALVCGNLQILLSLRRHHFYKALGYFLALEHLSPPRFRRLMAGWHRNRVSAEHAAYHRVHIEMDVDHCARWFRNVITPVL